MRSVTLLLLQVLATGSLAQITWDTAFTTGTAAPTTFSAAKRAVDALADDPYRCRNGGELYCCDYIGGRENPCKNKKNARAQSECPYLACCLTNGHGYYCLDPPSSEPSSSYSSPSYSSPYSTYEPSTSSSSSSYYSSPTPDPWSSSASPDPWSSSAAPDPYSSAPPAPVEAGPYGRRR